MALKLICFSVLMCAVFVCGTKPILLPTNDIQITAKEGRTFVEVPIIGTVFYLASKAIGVVISLASTLLELKIYAITFITDLASYIFQNCFPFTLIAAVITGLCSLSSIFVSPPSEEIEMDHRFIYAARSLDQASKKYEKYDNVK